MFSRPFLRLHHLAAAAALGAALHFAAATAPEGDDEADPAAGSTSTPWLSPGLRLHGTAPFGERWGTNEVRWQRQDGRSQWSARVSMSPLPAGEADALAAPSLQAEAQWLTRAVEGHTLRLGAQARHELQAATAAHGGALGAYAQEQWSIAPDWRLALGLRADAAAAATTALTPRAALSWQARRDLQLRLIDGVAWRDAHAGAGTTSPAVLANAQRLAATEFAVDWQALPSLRLAGSLHRQHEADAVAAAAAPALLPDATLHFAQLAAAGAVAAGDGVGLEGALAGEAGWGVRARWSAFQAHTDDAEAAAEVGGAARLFAALQAHAPLPWRGASAGVEWLRIDQRATAAGAAALTQTLINASVAWAPAGTPWRLAANAYNLADHALAEGATDALVRDGRHWQVQVMRAF